jgi:hypothetical protein
MIDDICHNFHELAVLTGARWRMNEYSPLPFHLAALHLADEMLDLELGDAGVE